MTTDRIITTLITNLIYQAPDYPWLDIFINSENLELNNTKASEQLSKFIQTQQKKILILINTDDLFIDVTIPSDHKVEIPEPDVLFQIDKITFQVYWD